MHDIIFKANPEVCVVVVVVVEENGAPSSLVFAKLER
jgi:rRNA maturation protein Rpf1